ncbi:MAG: exodeoxyribonuclease VII large subunit [Burkholderiales bacterium]|nr:exodeoxyribonuclease VII large subunit [Burkholderiales bacterium]
MNTHLSSPNAVFSVTELNRTVKGLLERELPLLWVSGEISNLTIAASGHCYFSLKDAGAQVRSVMFRNRAMLLPFKPREGLKVEARASVTLYEARGDYQLNVESMRPAGLGALFEAFEKLKVKLAAEGLFDTARKRALPAAPRAIGIVTSPQAAALRDVLTTLRRRAPHIPVILYPTAVQGEGSADTIAAMIGRANARAEVDVLIVCRGGGSIEDLWSFNEEIVARAIAASAIPVVSGVGHETDFTIADFAADLRAPTPTAAAELVSPDREALLATLMQGQMRLERTLRHRLQAAMQRWDYLGRRLVHPGERLRRQVDALRQLDLRRRQSMTRRMEATRWRLTGLGQRFRHERPDMSAMQRRVDQYGGAMQVQLARRLERSKGRVEAFAGRLLALNPEAVLARGYSLVAMQDGTLVRDSTQLRIGQPLRLTFARGEAKAVVSEAPVEQGDLF